MRKAITLGLVAFSLMLGGCAGEKKPDPKERPGFVDTSDPSKVPGLSPDPSKPPTTTPEAK